MGAAVSGDTGARDERGASGAAGRRRGASLAALLAAGALLAGCGTAAPEAVDPAGTADREPAPAAAPAGSAAGNASSAVRTDQGHDEQGGDTSPTAPAVDLPASWAGTYSTEAGPAGGYLVMQNLYGDGTGVDSMEGSQIETMEFFGGMDATCEGAATLAGDTADCALRDDGQGSGPTTAVAHLVPTAFDSTALLIEVGVADGFGVADSPQGIGGMGVADPARITESDAEGAVRDAVMLAEAPDGDVPEELAAQCELLDGGRHALCEVTGTPDGGGDGTWYGTVQTGYSRPIVLVTQLPA